MILASLIHTLQQNATYRFALIHSVLQTFCQLTLEIFIIIRHNELVQKFTNLQRNLDARLGDALNLNFLLFLLTSLVQVLFLLLSIRSQNSIHLFGLLILNLLLLSESGIQFFQSWLYFHHYIPNASYCREMYSFYLSLISITCLCCITSTWISWLLHKSFGWTLYKESGADLILQNQRFHFFLLNMLTEFGCFFYLSFFLHLFVMGGSLSSSVFDISVNVLMLVWTVIFVTVCCKIGLAKKSRGWIFGFLFSSLVANMFLVYTAIRILSDEKCPVRQMSLIFLVISILFNTASCVHVLSCLRYFRFTSKPSLSS
ncbi:hypothetical protein HMI54_007034 [Coelomomyces lativittatus]|nr:hypothetical protein HMI55_000402 [Coelomomyces lativittatus]KAJ1515708.1 hypothetical protein HMI56_001902 [Coelomomyces lativittatus]KAJ1517106.1 hypothetical protein HMI54_007034 [Coelomomyces lativittatus]